MTARGPITQALAELAGGDPRAANRLMPLVYDELRRLARQYLRRESNGHTLEPTALVHEAFLRLVGQADASWENRVHFFAVAAQAMRHILVDHARGRRAEKRGGARHKLPLERVAPAAWERDDYLVALDEALGKLAAIDAVQCRIVELRFFAGLTIDETARALNVSPSTVQRDWLMARGWLHREIMKGE